MGQFWSYENFPFNIICVEWSYLCISDTFKDTGNFKFKFAGERLTEENK